MLRRLKRKTLTEIKGKSGLPIEVPSILSVNYIEKVMNLLYGERIPEIPKSTL